MTTARDGRWVVAAGLTLVLAGAGRAADVKIENYSNDTVYVSQADNRGAAVSHGWTAIKSNETKTFKAADALDLFIRVQDKNGNEITFQHHKKFLNFPTHTDRFSVSAEPDDAKVWVLKHGPKLEHTRNINKGGALPAGWTSKRFFEIGTGSHKLEIKP